MDIKQTLGNLKEKIQNIFQRLKEDNKNFAVTTARINNRENFFGNVNRRVKGGDFYEGSYLSIESETGVIYSTTYDDYTFKKDDIAEFKLIDTSIAPIRMGDQSYPAECYRLSLKDGKTAQVDMIKMKVVKFKATFDL